LKKNIFGLLLLLVLSISAVPVKANPDIVQSWQTPQAIVIDGELTERQWDHTHWIRNSKVNTQGLNHTAYWSSTWNGTDFYAAWDVVRPFPNQTSWYNGWGANLFIDSFNKRGNYSDRSVWLLVLQICEDPRASPKFQLFWANGTNTEWPAKISTRPPTYAYVAAKYGVYPSMHSKDPHLIFEIKMNLNWVFQSNATVTFDSWVGYSCSSCVNQKELGLDITKADYDYPRTWAYLSKSSTLVASEFEVTFTIMSVAMVAVLTILRRRRRQIP
jgi:hypothetical protein